MPVLIEELPINVDSSNEKNETLGSDLESRNFNIEPISGDEKNNIELIEKKKELKSQNSEIKNEIVENETSKPQNDVKPSQSSSVYGGVR